MTKHTRSMSSARVPRPGPSSTTCKVSVAPACIHSLTHHTPISCNKSSQKLLSSINNYCNNNCNNCAITWNSFIRKTPVMLSLALVFLGTNLQYLVLALALKVQSLVLFLALILQSLVLALAWSIESLQMAGVSQTTWNITDHDRNQNYDTVTLCHYSVPTLLPWLQHQQLSVTSPNIWLISGDVIKSPRCPNTSRCM